MNSPLLLSPAWDAPVRQIRRTWAGIGNIDQFRWLVRQDVRSQLVMARDEIGLRHVRACAMFSPELRVRTPVLSDWKTPPPDRLWTNNWQTVDYCLDGLLDLGLKPIVTTCFTPDWMTSDPASCWPDQNRTTPPTDLDAWAAFLDDFLQHLIQRYGRNEVESWYFECWNEPNLQGFFNGSQQDFLNLWSATWRALKGRLPEGRLGGPSTARGEWIPPFLDWAEADGTPPDYLISHVYNNDSESEPLSPFDGPAADRVIDSPHFATGVIRGVHKLLADRGWRGEVHWNEWGRSWFPHDPRRETALEAAFIVKTMAEVSQLADSFAFWCLSDIYDQIGFTASEFDAHYGMLSLHGLRKPAWWAHVLLGRLGQNLHPHSGGDEFTGVLATRSGDRVAALVYAYPKSSDAPSESLKVRLTLPKQATEVRLTRLGETENNIVATWRAMGAPAHPTRGQLEELTAANKLSTAEPDHVEADSATFRIERPGVVLLECSIT